MELQKNTERQSFLNSIHISYADLRELIDIINDKTASGKYIISAEDSELTVSLRGYLAGGLQRARAAGADIELNLSDEECKLLLKYLHDVQDIYFLQLKRQLLEMFGENGAEDIDGEKISLNLGDENLTNLRRAIVYSANSKYYRLANSILGPKGIQTLLAKLSNPKTDVHTGEQYVDFNDLEANYIAEVIVSTGEFMLVLEGVRGMLEDLGYVTRRVPIYTSDILHLGVQRVYLEELLNVLELGGLEDEICSKIRERLDEVRVGLVDVWLAHKDVLTFKAVFDSSKDQNPKVREVIQIFDEQFKVLKRGKAR